MKPNGYRASHRNRWLLITNKILDEKEFLLFEYYLDCMDWDSNHDKHGVFEVFFKEIAPNFDKSVDTIRLWHNGLLNKGFIRLVDSDRNLYEIKNPERYSFDGRKGGKASEFGKNEKTNPAPEFFLKNVCFSPDKIEINLPKQTTLASNNQKALTSFKSELSVISNSKSTDISPIGFKKVIVISQDLRSNEEYQKIYTEGDFQSLTPEDMKWVDENVSEKIVIENKEQEKEIVEVFFNGECNEYQKHVIYC